MGALQKRLKFEKFEFDKVIIIRLLYMPQEVIFFQKNKFWNLNIRPFLLKSAVLEQIGGNPRWRHLGVPEQVRVQS